ncbi:hypothetical protein [Coleofasciculus sp.]|uniref:hypothetical protein n=1 Tax=Coleofasciculus sp. TaxID=3100458 RepID=UPI003A1F6E14
MRGCRGAKILEEKCLDVGAGLGTIVGAGLGIIVGAGLGIIVSYSPITVEQNPPFLTDKETTPPAQGNQLIQNRIIKPIRFLTAIALFYPPVAIFPTVTFTCGKLP